MQDNSLGKTRNVAPSLLAALVFDPVTPWQRYLPPLAWALFIFVLSAMPGSAYPEVRLPFADKVVHASLYLPLGYWLARALCVAEHSSWHRKIIAFLLVAGYGLSDEIHQLFVPQRTFSLGDWAVDCVAGALGVLIWHLGQRWREPPRESCTPGNSAKM